MLQRLFARHASEERIEDAVDHGKAMADQDALRERSHLILERLARKQAAARQEEIDARRLAREAAEEAKAAPPPVEPAKTPAETGAAEVPASAEAPAGEPENAVAHVPEASGETAQQHFEAPSAAHEETVRGMADPDAGTTAADRSAYISDDAPLRTGADDHAEPRYEAPQTDLPPGDDEPAAEPQAEIPTEPSHFEPSAGPDADMHAEHMVPDIHDDPEAMEQIRKKAEEAKARIAARLQQLEADEHEEEVQTDSPNRRLDLGEDTPPVLPDDSDG